jgi:hypothetical protein
MNQSSIIRIADGADRTEHRMVGQLRVVDI